MGMFDRIQAQLTSLCERLNPRPRVLDVELGIQLLDLQAGDPKTDWDTMMVPFCLSAAAVLVQASTISQSKVSPIFVFFYFLIGLRFLSFFVSRFMDSRSLVKKLVLYRLGVFFGVTAFWTAITLPFPLWLKIGGWMVYVISMLVVLKSYF